MNKAKYICKVNGIKYFIHSSGKVFKKENNKIIEIKPKMGKYDFYIYINRKQYLIKKLVAMAFLKDYRKGHRIFFKNKDHTDCSVENLYSISASEYGKKFGKYLSGRSKPVKIIKNGETKKYYSMRECSKDLGVSLKTLQNRLKGHNNMLKDIHIELL
mgnify:FL=1